MASVLVLALDIDGSRHQYGDVDTRTVARRAELGGHFSEGARMLWLALDSRGWSQADARRELAAHLGEIHRLLYGDILPRLALANRIKAALQIGTEMWSELPRAKFVPPAARRPRKAA